MPSTVSPETQPQVTGRPTEYQIVFLYLALINEQSRKGILLLILLFSSVKACAEFRE